MYLNRLFVIGVKNMNFQRIEKVMVLLMNSLTIVNQLFVMIWLEILLQDIVV